jgi:hypothetical protein
VYHLIALIFIGLIAPHPPSRRLMTAARIWFGPIARLVPQTRITTTRPIDRYAATLAIR